IMISAGLRLALPASSAIAPSPEYARPRPEEENSFNWKPADQADVETIATATANAVFLNRVFWLMTITSLSYFYSIIVTYRNRSAKCRVCGITYKSDQWREYRSDQLECCKFVY